MTLTGRVPLTDARWWCPQCHRLYRPHLDTLALPPGTFTWAVGERAAHLGALLPAYARATDCLAYLTGITLSAREMELCTEGLGAAYRVPDRPRGTLGPPADVLFVEGDAVQLHFRDPKPWHEEKVFCVWRQVGETLMPPQYWTADGSWDAHLAALQSLAEREGLDTAKVIVSLGDGAHPLWTLLTALAPHAVQLLDWYHLQEHLATVAKLLPASDGAPWHAAQRAHLTAGAWRTVIRALLVHARDGDTAELRKAATQCVGYLWWHRGRLNYPLARACGYPIGSGRIESACKQVVQQRCKGPGMRWEHAQVEAVLHARCAWLNADWAVACRQWRATGRFAPLGEVKQVA